MSAGCSSTAADARVREAALPALDHDLLDDPSRAGQHVVEVGEEGVAHGVVVEPVEPAREAGGGVGHEAAAGRARRLAGTAHVRRVEQHAERAFRRRDGVEVVPRHRARLARQDGADDERAVRDRCERGGRVVGQRRDDLTRHVRGGGDDRGARVDHAAALDLDTDAVLRGLHLRRACAEPDTVAERRGERVGEAARAAEDVPREPSLPVPDEMEVPDAVPGSELFRLARGAGQGGAEEQVDVLRKLPGELREGAVVHEREHPLLALGVILAFARRRDLGIAADGEAQPHSGANELQPRPERHRQPEREALDRAARDELAVQRDGGEPAGDGLGAHAELRRAAAPWPSSRRRRRERRS